MFVIMLNIKCERINEIKFNSNEKTGDSYRVVAVRKYGMADEQNQRNFRSYYYAKVGFPSVEEKKSLEILFKDNELDAVKLEQFSIRFHMPSIYRLMIWKILLHVLPRYQSNHEFVWKIKCEMYEDFYFTVLVTQLAQSCTPNCSKFLKMYLLAERKLLFDHKTQENEPKWQHFLAIANVFDELLKNKEEEAFWLTKNFFNFIQRYYDTIPSWVDYVDIILLKEDAELHKHLTAINGLKSLPLDIWFYRCFAGVIPVDPLTRIWDKIIGGAFKILPYVATAILLGLRRQLYSAKSATDVLNVISDKLDESAEVITSKAIDIWQKHGSHIASNK